MSGGASAEALYARLENDVSKAVTHVNSMLLSGLPTDSDSYLSEAKFPTDVVYETAAEIKKTIAASERPNAIAK